MPTLEYVWGGHMRVNLPDVGAGQCVSVHLQAVCFAPGTCSISDYFVSWTYPGLDNLTGGIAGPPVAVVVQQHAV